MADHEKHDHKDELGRTIAALFQSKEEARAAIKPLHKADYKHTWIGTTSVATADGGDTAVTVENGGFFAGTESLVDSLVKRGVLGDSARKLEGQMQPGNAILTVDPKDHDAQEAIALITQAGGRVAGSTSTNFQQPWPQPTGGSLASDQFSDADYEEVFFARR